MDADVIVIGAGMAGLSAAWELRKAGLSAKVLEKSSAPGGRVATEPFDGASVDTAAGFFANVFKDVVSLIEELGLKSNTVPIGGKVAIVRSGQLRRTRAHNGIPGAVPLPALMRIANVLVPLLMWWRRLDLHAPEEAFRADTRTLAEYAQAAFGDDVSSYLIQPALASTFFWTPEETSQAIFLLLLRHAIGMRRFTFQDGMGTLPAALARNADLETGIEVRRVIPETSGYRIETSAGLIFRGKAVVVAADAFSAADMVPQLPPTFRKFFSSVRYSATIILAVRVKHRPLGDHQNVLFPRKENMTRYLIGISSTAGKNIRQTPEGGDALRLYMSSAAARLLADRSDEEIRDLLIEDLGRTPVKVTLGDIQMYRVFRWPHALPEYPVGYLAQLREFQASQRELPSLAFCGDYLGGPSIEGAVSSGREGALRIASQILSGG